MVHVARKVHALHLGRKRKLPAKIGRFRVDVIEVGSLRAHALDASDELMSPGVPARTGTLTALLGSAHGGLALLSGHVGLPIRNGLIVGSYDSHDDPPHSISAVDAMSQQRLSGNLLRGGISARADWTLARFSSAGSRGLDPIHPLVDSPPPLQLRLGPLAPGEPLRHFSRLTGREMRGKYVHRALSAVEVVLADGSRRRYSDLLVVAGTNGTFSRGGDSGSLVGDGNRHVVGIILGGDDNGTLSYVLPAQNLRFALADTFAEFFRE